MSDSVLGTHASYAGGVTDVFLLCRGWIGDLPSAWGQYDAWVGAVMFSCPASLARAAHVGSNLSKQF